MGILKDLCDHIAIVKSEHVVEYVRLPDAVWDAVSEEYIREKLRSGSLPVTGMEVLGVLIEVSDDFEGITFFTADDPDD
jgi:hypothetical protein